ncbi:MAG TPA: GNAT family N-acetyltransferase [Opitutales bacterium]|nr:GNAT family N-acetyltransferase [Opitutales bacterium]
MPLDDVIDAGDPRWSEFLRKFPRHDFYHLPAYVTLEAERRGGRARAYVYHDNLGTMMIPFVESSAPLAMQPSGLPTQDALAPYGYTSPLVELRGGERENGELLARVLERLAEHLRQRNICAMLMRFHPLLPVPQASFRTHGRLVTHGETVWCNLRQSPEALWGETRGRYRSYIHALEREGYQVEFDPAGRDMDAFFEIYYDTMRRVNAAPDYFFSKEYLQSLQKLLGERFLLAHVRSPAGRIVSSGFFTFCQGLVQYHLSGNDIGDEGANALKLLLHRVRLQARDAGYEKFHLGGGVGARKDSLFQFKSGFSPQRATFCTWRMVVDQPAYDRLCRQWERLNRAMADPPEGFFPAYRKMLPPPPAIERRCA